MGSFDKIEEGLKSEDNVESADNHENKDDFYRLSGPLRVANKTEECAREIYEKAMQNESIKEIDNELVRSACLYIACRQNKEPYDISEFAAATNIKEKQMRRTFGIITRRLNLKLEPISPLVYIPRFSSDLKLSEKAQAKAIEIIEKAIESRIHRGINPKGIAAAAIYLACESIDEKIEQRKIADIVGVTEVTIRLRCADLAVFV
jgi:transcription initiation factor TFIIB